MKHIAFLSVKWMSVGLGMLSLLLSVASCGDKEYGDAMNEAQLMNDIEVNVGSSLPLAVGMDFVLDYKPVPENVTNPEITLTSSDENVVSVSQDGRVTAKMIGKAYINLSQSTAFETLKTIEVQVMPVATAIELENVELFEGTNKKVIVNVTPSDGYNVFDWKSDNEEVATVADDGTITGKKPGTANISVSSQDGSQLTATAVVTVKEVIPIDKGTDEDKRVVGNGLPKFTMSVTHTFRYKNLDLNLYFRGNLGYQIYDVHDLYYGLQDAAPNTNVLESAYKENREITTGKNVHSSYFVHNGDFMKLDVATLGYTWNINNKWVEKARFYITGRNLFTISGYHRGLDKDAYCVNGMEPGLPYSKNGYYPSSRQFLFGIQLNF